MLACIYPLVLMPMEGGEDTHRWREGNSNTATGKACNQFFLTCFCMWFLQPLGSCWYQDSCFFRSVKWLSLPGHLLTREWTWRFCVWCFYPYWGIHFPGYMYCLLVCCFMIHMYTSSKKVWFLLYTAAWEWIRPWFDIEYIERNRYFPNIFPRRIGSIPAT